MTLGTAQPGEARGTFRLGKGILRLLARQKKCQQLLLDIAIERQLRRFASRSALLRGKAIVPDAKWQRLRSVSVSGGSAGRMNRSTHARRSIRCLQSPS